MKSEVNVLLDSGDVEKLDGFQQISQDERITKALALYPSAVAAWIVEYPTPYVSCVRRAPWKNGP